MQESVVFINTQQIATNKALIKGGLKPEKAKPASNAKIIKANRSTMASLEKNVKNNRKRMKIPASSFSRSAYLQCKMRIFRIFNL